MSRIIVKNVTTDRELLWRHIKIKKSLDNICHTLELELPASERAKVRKHDKITVRYVNSIVREPNGLVTTVLVDEITASADTEKNSVMVIGRSPARDIIDSTWSSSWEEDKILKHKTLYEITKSIAGEFGIRCYYIPKNTIDPTITIIGVFSWENESPWMKLITSADSQNFILTSSQAGDLYIWKPEGAVREGGFFLKEGKNIKTIEWKQNGAGQYHKYIINTLSYTGRAEDTTCNNNRILTINLTDFYIDQESVDRRAKTEMNRRMEDRITVTVPGWGLTDEQIKNNLGTNLNGKEIFWTPNLLIPVSMSSLSLNVSLLIAEVEQEASVETMGSTITLVKRSAYL